MHRLSSFILLIQQQPQTLSEPFMPDKHYWTKCYLILSVHSCADVQAVCRNEMGKTKELIFVKCDLEGMFY